MNDAQNTSPGQPAPPPPPPQAQPQPAPAPAGPPPWWYHPPHKPKSGILRKLGIMIFILSILANVYLLMAVAAMTPSGATTRSVLASGSEDQVIAVYRIIGAIDDHAVEAFRGFRRDVANDKAVRAIVLRVDSPGGTMSASDQIHAWIKDLMENSKKKLVVSMGGVAASGGYYISAPADEIYAEKTTITGSIGVLMGWVVLEGTLDKIGIEPVVIKSTNSAGWKDAVSPFQKPDARQQANLQALVDKMQERFEQVVREGRGSRLKTAEVQYTMTVGTGEDAHTVGRTDILPLNGQVFLPEEAMKYGLIDAIGYEDDAIDAAAKLAGLTNPKVVLYEPRRSFFQRLAEGKIPAGVEISADLLDQLQSPRLLLLWKVD